MLAEEPAGGFDRIKAAVRYVPTGVGTNLGYRGPDRTSQGGGLSGQQLLCVRAENTAGLRRVHQGRALVQPGPQARRLASGPDRAAFIIEGTARDLSGSSMRRAATAPLSQAEQGLMLRTGLLMPWEQVRRRTGLSLRLPEVLGALGQDLGTFAWLAAAQSVIEQGDDAERPGPVTRRNGQSAPEQEAGPSQLTAGEATSDTRAPSPRYSL